MDEKILDDRTYGKWVKLTNYEYEEKKYGYFVLPIIYEFKEVKEGTRGSFLAPREMIGSKKYKLPDLPFDSLDMSYGLVYDSVLELNTRDDINSIEDLRKYIEDFLNDYKVQTDKKWFFLPDGKLNKRNETLSVKHFVRLGTNPLVNCFINIIKDYISKEDYDRFETAKYMTKEEIQTLATKYKFIVKFYDATKKLWTTTYGIRNIENSNKKKTFHIMVNNEHCLSMITSIRYTASKQELDKCALKYFSKRGKLLRAYNLKGNNIEELRHLDDYFSPHQRADLDDEEYWSNLVENQLSIKQQYMQYLRDTLLPDNYYTKNLPFYYLNYIPINPDNIHYGKTLFSYDSSKHFYRHKDCKFYKHYKFAAPPNKHLNNTSDIHLLDYSGFVYLVDYEILKTKILHHILHKNIAYPSFFIKYLLDENLIILNKFNISYNESNLDVDINEWFYDKEFTKDRKKELYTNCYGMLTKSLVDDKLNYITIDSNDENEIQQLMSNKNFLFLEEKNNEYKFYLKQEPHEMKRTYTAHWLYIIYYAICNTLEFYLTIDEDIICEIYVDSIRTYTPVNNIPKNWRFEAYKDKRNLSTHKKETENISLDEELNPTYNLYYGIAGAGKSYGLLNNPPKNCIFLCPTHDLINGHKENYPNLEYSTYHKFFNIGTKYQHIKPTDYTNIILDEMGMISDDLYINHILPYMKANPWVRMYFIYGLNQLGSDRNKMFSMLKQIPNIHIKEFNIIYRIQDEEFKNKVYQLHEKKDLIEHIKLFSNRLITLEELPNYYKKGDITLVSKHKLINELDLHKYKPSTYHSIQGRTITNRIFIICSELFDYYMISMGITRLRDIDNLYLVKTNKLLLTMWDSYLIDGGITEEKEEKKPVIKISKKKMKELKENVVYSRLRYLKSKNQQDKLSMDECISLHDEYEKIYKSQLKPVDKVKIKIPDNFIEYEKDKKMITKNKKINNEFIKL